MRLSSRFLVVTAATLIAGAAFAFDNVTVEAPWAIEDALPDPKKGAKLECALIDQQCNVGTGQGVSVGATKTGDGTASGTEKFNFTGPEAKDPVGVECKISAPNFKAGPEAKVTRPIPGTSAPCMVQEDGKWKALDLVEMQKRQSAWAAARAKQVEADRKARAAARGTQDAADKKAQEDFRKMRAATEAAREDDLRRRAAARKQTKEYLAAEAKRKAEAAERKKFTDARAEAYWCTNNPKNSTAKKVLAHCQSTKGRFSMKGKCVNGECLESDRTEPTYDAVCSYNIDCDNKQYEGICKKKNPKDKYGSCVSRKRESCTPGDIHPCFPVGSPYGGTAVCNKDGVLGTCKSSYDDLKSNKDAENDPRSAWKAPSKLNWTKTTKKLDTDGANCKIISGGVLKHSDCNNTEYEGRCHCSKKDASGKCVDGRCKAVKRQSCSALHTVKLCFTQDGRRTAGKRKCHLAPDNTKKYMDCESTVKDQKEYNKHLADYAANKKEWDDYLNQAVFSHGGVTPINSANSPCTNHSLCRNNGFVGYCANISPKTGKGLCRTETREGCAEAGRVAACVDPFSKKLGYRICKPGGAKDMKWSDCKTADEKKRDLPDLKRAGKM